MALLMESKSILKKRFQVGGPNPQVIQFLWFLLLTESVDFIVWVFNELPLPHRVNKTIAG